MKDAIARLEVDHEPSEESLAQTVVPLYYLSLPPLSSSIHHFELLTLQ
jgi:hypothetical protein